MSTAKPTINEAFAARRAELLAARHRQFQPEQNGVLHNQIGHIDFAPDQGFCTHWNIHLPGEPRCNYDLVAHYAEDYPTAPITGCPHCGSSYCD